MKIMYEVYKATYAGSIVYIGSGIAGRHEHINSGTSHIYEANKIHFNGGKVLVDIIATFNTKDESLVLEKDLIQKINPAWNIQYTGGADYRRIIGMVLKSKDDCLGKHSLWLLYYAKTRLMNDGTFLIKTQEYLDMTGLSFANFLKHFRRRVKDHEYVVSIKNTNAKGIYSVKISDQFLRNLSLNIQELKRKYSLPE